MNNWTEDEKPENYLITIDQVKYALGEDAEEFIKVMEIVNDIIVDPSKYTGMKAAVIANQLAAFRMAIGIKAQYYKTAGSSMEVRKRKNALIAMETHLAENINCLKLIARFDGRLTGMM